MTQFPLIQGQFSRQEALELITKLIAVKIRFHEDKIRDSSQEEDIKMRETRIKQLQKELYELRRSWDQEKGQVSLQAIIEIN
jgi:hypothetical protein